MRKVLNLGSINLDHVYHVPHFVRPGETASSTSYQGFIGGKGLNQSIAIRLAGTEVHHAGMIGDDGDAALNHLKQYGVHTELIQRCAEKTGHAIIQVDSAGQNSILLYGGANQAITPDDIRRSIAPFFSDDIIVLQNEINALDEALCEANQKGMQIILNPSPVSPALLCSHLEYVHWFILNELEAAALTGCEIVESMLSAMVAKFPHAGIVLTLGDQGAILYSGGQTIHRPAYTVDVKDTTAAGDTFLGYFVAGIVQNMPAAQALRFASAASAIAVSRNGASQSIPTADEVNRFLSAHSEALQKPSVERNGRII